MSMRGVIRGCLGLLVLLLTSPAWSAATLNGVVLLQRRHGAPVAGVEISARGANVVTTGNDGLFVLRFPNGRPGQDVSVHVKRDGWDVVNDILLDQRLPDPANTRELEIILCRRAEREELRAEFYRLKGKETVLQTYQMKVAELEGRGRATAEERERLVRERDQALAQVEEWARQAATRKPEEVGGTYREAMQLFLDGTVDAALQVLSDERLQQDADKAQDQLKQVVQSWLLKGQLLSSQFDYAGAGRVYQKAVESAPGSAEAWFAFAYFHQQQNLFVQARRGYEQVLTLARQHSDDATVATTLNNLGNLNTDEHHHAEARKQYEEALDLYRALAAKNPDLYLPDIAMTLNNLGVLSRDENRKADARNQYEEALSLYRSLATKNPDFLRDVAMTLNNLGVLSRDENRKADARAQYEEALSLYRSLATKNPDFLPDVAQTLNNLGVLSRAEKNNAEARAHYEEALDLYRGLANKNSDLYLPDIAMTLNNLGVLSRDENRKTDARKYYEEALDLYRALANKNPDVYQPCVRRVEDKLRSLPE